MDRYSFVFSSVQSHEKETIFNLKLCFFFISRSIWEELDKNRAKKFENIMKIIKEEDRVAKLKRDKAKKEKERKIEELKKKREKEGGKRE